MNNRMLKTGIKAAMAKLTSRNRRTQSKNACLTCWTKLWMLTTTDARMAKAKKARARTS
jgi:hypothetical protein